MYSSPILVVAGEPNSVFLEIYFKSIKKLKIKNPLILIASIKLVKLQMKKLKFSKKIKLLSSHQLSKYKLDNKYINLINVEYTQKQAFSKISNKSNKYVEECLNLSFQIIKK